VTPIRVDLHTNLGVFPGSINSKTKIETTVQSLSAFLTKYNITTHVCLYPYNGYSMLEALAEQLPNVKHLGLQVLGGVSPEEPVNIEKVQLDVGKRLFRGIKLASHRGWWKKNGVVESGLHYAKNTKYIRRWLQRLPTDSLAAFHLQGDSAWQPFSRPEHVARYALAFPNLKFIMCHSGDYCQAGLSARPIVYVNPNVKECYFPVFRYHHS